MADRGRAAPTANPLSGLPEFRREYDEPQARDQLVWPAGLPKNKDAEKREGA